MSFQPVPAYARTRLSDVVADQIKDLIARAELLPGARLPAERELAARLGVSRPSLREALVRLEADGYLRAGARGGLQICDLSAPLLSNPLGELLMRSPQASFDLLELRRDLEAAASAHAAQRADTADRARIDAAFAALSEAAVHGDTGRLAEFDAAFHRAIADATHNVALTHVLHGIHDLIHASMLRSHRLGDEEAGVEAALFAQHRAIHAAIQARDAEAARQCTADHLDYVQRLYRERARRDA